MVSTVRPNKALIKSTYTEKDRLALLTAHTSALQIILVSTLLIKLKAKAPNIISNPEPPMCVIIIGLKICAPVLF